MLPLVVTHVIVRADIGAAGGDWGRRKEAETLGWFRRQRRVNAGRNIQSQTAEAGSVRARQLTADAGPGRGEGGAGPPGMDPEGAGEPRIGRCLFPTPASAEKLRQRKYQMMTPNTHSVGETEATYLEGPGNLGWRSHIPLSSHVFPAGEHRRRRPMTARHARLAQEGIGPRAREHLRAARAGCVRQGQGAVPSVPYRTVPPHALVGRYRTAPDLCAFAQARAQPQAQPQRSHNHTQAHGHVGAHTQSQRGTGALNTRHWPPAGAGASPNVQLTDSLSAGPLVDGSTHPALWSTALPWLWALWPVACRLWAINPSIPPPSNAQHPSTRYYSSLLNQAPSNLHYHSMCHPPHIHSFLRHPSMIQP